MTGEDLEDLATRLRRRVANLGSGPFSIERMDELAAAARELFELLFVEVWFAARPAVDDAFETLDLVEMARENLEVSEYWREAWPTANRSSRQFMTDRLSARAAEAAEFLEVAIDEAGLLEQPR